MKNLFTKIKDAVFGGVIRAWVSAILAIAIAAGGVVALTPNKTDDTVQEKTVDVLEAIKEYLPKAEEESEKEETSTDNQ